MKKILIAVALAVLATAAGAGQDPRELRLNQVQWKASHNSYAKPTDMSVQIGDWNLRSIEFDLHVAKKKPLQKKIVAPDGDFLVFHNAMDDFSNCRLLSECLGRVTDFHDQDPDHDVITIFFDMEGIGAPGHSPDDLYDRFRASLPKDSIFAPKDLLASCPGAQTLQEAVTRKDCGWPKLKDLKGRVMLVVSDGREAFRQPPGYDLTTALLFLVAKGSKPEALHADPNIVFFNMSGASPFATTVLEAGFVSRCYWLDQEDRYLAAKRLGCHHLATDLVDPDQYPYTSTTQEDGTPFQPL